MNEWILGCFLNSSRVARPLRVDLCEELVCVHFSVKISQHVANNREWDSWLNEECGAEGFQNLLWVRPKMSRLTLCPAGGSWCSQPAFLFSSQFCTWRRELGNGRQQDSLSQEMAHRYFFHQPHFWLGWKQEGGVAIGHGTRNGVWLEVRADSDYTMFFLVPTEWAKCQDRLATNRNHSKPTASEKRRLKWALRSPFSKFSMCQALSRAGVKWQQQVV